MAPFRFIRLSLGSVGLPVGAGGENRCRRRRERIAAGYEDCLRCVHGVPALVGGRVRPDWPHPSTFRVQPTHQHGAAASPPVATSVEDACECLQAMGGALVVGGRGWVVRCALCRRWAVALRVQPH